MKIWVVMDEFHGTDSECFHGLPVSLHTNENVARAIAASRYAHSVENFELDESNAPPEYARVVYEKLLRERRGLPPKKKPRS